MPLILKVAIYVAAFLLVGFIISYIIVDYVLFCKFFNGVSSEKLDKIGLKPDYYKPCLDKIEKSRRRMESLPCERVFCTATDGVKLSARYYDNGSDTAVVFFHGARAIPWNNFGYIGERFFDRGYDILIPDMRAHGLSGGKRMTFGNAEHKDVLTWLEFLKGKTNIKNIVLYGISMGASAICYASDEIDDKRVTAMIIDCGFTSPYELEKHILSSNGVPEWLMAGSVWAGEAIAKVKQHEQTESHLKRTEIPALFVHGEDDIVVPLSHGKRNFEACASEKDMIIVKNAGHTVATIVGGDDVCDKIAEFAEKHKSRIA